MCSERPTAQTTAQILANLFWISSVSIVGLSGLMQKLQHSQPKMTGLETHEKVLLYVFYHVFFVGMCTVLR